MDEARLEQPKTSIIVMSASGKPISVCGFEETRVPRVCGLVQALRATVTTVAELGDIRRIQSREEQILFVSAQSVTLVATGSRDVSEKYMMLTLEYIYSLIICALTEQLHAWYNQNPALDMLAVLDETTSTSLPALIESLEQNPTCFFSMGIPMFGPLTADIRARVSEHMMDLFRGSIFGFLVVGRDHKVVSLVHRDDGTLHPADFHLLQLILKQKELTRSDLWFPICFPRFHSKGFLHCYTHCLDVSADLSIILLATDGSTQQFQTFCRMADNFRSSIGLPKRPTMRCLADSIEEVSSDDSMPEKDYVQVSLDGDQILPYLPETFIGAQLLQEIDDAKRHQASAAICGTHKKEVLCMCIRSSGAEAKRQQSDPPQVYISENVQHLWKERLNVFQSLCLSKRTSSTSLEGKRYTQTRRPNIVSSCPTMELLKSNADVMDEVFTECIGNQIYLSIARAPIEL